MTLTSQSHERAETSSARISPSRITVARLRRGLTKAELAANLDIAPATLSRWENEGPPPSRTESVIEQLETALRFTAGYFISEQLTLMASSYADQAFYAPNPQRPHDERLRKAVASHH